MSGIQFSSPVTNQKESPAVYASSLATRPSPQLPGRIFVDTDNPSTGMYRDTGTVWVQIAETGASDTDTLQTVTNRGNTTTNEVTIGSATAPTAPLDVYGGGDTPDIVAKIQGTSTNSAFIQFTQNGTAQFFTGNRYKGGANLYIIGNSQTPQDTVLINSSTNRIAIGGHTDTPAYLLSIGGTLQNTTSAYLSTDSGNVGIGTTSVNSTLEIYKASGTNYIYLTNGTSGTNNGVVLRFNNTDYMGMIGTFTSGELKVGGFNSGGYFMTFYSNNSERMRLTPSGRLLIGTSTESTYILDANGTVRVQGTELRLDNGTTGTLNIYSATPIINFFSGGGYTFGRSGTTMIWNSANIALQISGNSGYTLDGSSGHVWRTALSGGAALARLDTGGSLSIGNSSTAANASSILDLTSTTKGFLPPRMTTAQINAITTPAEGLIAFNTTISHLCVYQAGAWAKLSHSPM